MTVGAVQYPSGCAFGKARRGARPAHHVLRGTLRHSEVFLILR
jgi:hypothetical protein